MLELVVPAQVEGLPLWPLLLCIGGLVVLNVINNRITPPRFYLLWAIGGAAAFLALGWFDGNTWTDMGLGAGYVVWGAIWGLGCIGVVALGYAIATTFRRGRDALQDERVARLSVGRLVFQALIEVPFGTVLLEEIAFRAVLFAMLARRYGVAWAIVISAILFGLWHVLPSWGTHEQSAALGSVVGDGLRGNILAVLVSVITTAVAGVVFVLLRLVSGSVLAPMGLHWATNGLGYAFSWLVIRARQSRPPSA